MKFIKTCVAQLLAVTFAMSLVNLPTQQAQAVDLGPFSVTVGFCAQIQKLGAIVNSTTIVEWPTTGYPGITMGLLQNTSVLMDFCSYITQLESLDTSQAIFFSANYLNTLTGKKWDAHLQQADRTWNLANSVYDFESGTTRKGAMSSESTYRELNDYALETKQWGSKTFNGRDADVRTRGQKEADMQRFAGAAYRRAILKEMTACPEPTDSTKYGEIYKAKIQPLVQPRDDAQEDYLFFKEKLLDMGPKFLNGESELATYVTEVELMETGGVGYQVTETKRTDTSVKNDPTKKGADGYPVKDKVDIQRYTQSFTARINSDPFTKFNSKYEERWKSYVEGQVLGAGSFGILDNPTKRVEDDFKELSYKCNERKLSSGMDQNSPSYDVDLAKKIKDCKDQENQNIKDVKNLLVYYTTQLQNSLYQYKTANAKMWSFESQYLGRTRVVTANTQGQFATEEVSCAQNLTPAEMDKLALKQQAVNNELNEIIAKEVLKQSAREEMEQKQRAEADKEASIRKNMVDKKAADQKTQDRLNTGISPNRSGIGGSKQ